jgi:hypothetical protein
MAHHANPDAESIASLYSTHYGGAPVVTLWSRGASSPPAHKHYVLAKDSKERHGQTASHRDCHQPDVRHHINARFHCYRFVIAMLAGTAVGMMLFHRYSMAMAILRMVNQTHLYLETHPNSTYQDFLDEGHLPGGEFLWNNEVSKTLDRDGAPL